MLRSASMSQTTTRRMPTALPPWLLALGLLLPTLSACAPKEADPEIARQEIQAFLGDYLPKLAEAYESSEATRLEGFAVPKEIASIEKLIGDLAAQGRAIHPSLESFTVEEVSLASYTIALVTVLEVWDFRTVALGSGTQIHEVLDQRKRVKYQMRRQGEGWVVTYRHVVDHDLG